MKVEEYNKILAAVAEDENFILMLASNPDLQEAYVGPHPMADLPPEETQTWFHRCFHELDSVLIDGIVRRPLIMGGYMRQVLSAPDMPGLLIADIALSWHQSYRATYRT